MSCPLAGLGQNALNPTDTSYVQATLRQAEAIEMQNPQKALRQYQRALAVSQRIGYTKGYFDSLRLIAYILYILGRHDEAYRLATVGLQKAMQDTSQRYRSLCHFALAQSARAQGKNKLAIRHFEQAAPFILARRNPNKIASLYQNLGLVYETENLYPQALAYFEKAIRYDRIANSPPFDVAIDYQSVAAILVKQNKLRPGLAYYQKAIALLDTNRDLELLTQIAGNQGNVYKELGQLDSSLYYYKNALRMNQRLNNPVRQLHLLAGLAETYNALNQYERAKTLLDQSASMAKLQQAGLSEWRNIYREQANAALGVGNYKEAVSWYDKYMQTKDSLSTLDAKALLATYDVKIRQAEAGQKLAQKQRQIIQMEQDRQTQRMWLWLAVLAGISLAGGLAFAFLYARQRQRIADNALLVAETEHALAVVQSELTGQRKERVRIAKEMHDDLGASLTAIGLLSEVVKTRMGAATTPEVEKISSISAEMITSMNEIIWSLNTKNDSLNGLIGYTRAYASEFIDNTPLMLKTDVSEAPQDVPIRGGDRRNVFLTVKEALNNVVKHAQATRASLTIRADGGQLLIEVSDNGRGFSLNTQAHHRNGLGNMQQRMRESGGSCVISTQPGGTHIAITFPFESMAPAKILQL